MGSVGAAQRAAMLPKWAAALRSAQLGGSPARVVFIGDSHVVGWSPVGEGAPATDRVSVQTRTKLALVGFSAGELADGWHSWSGNSYDTGVFGGNPTNTYWTAGSGWTQTTSGFGWANNSMLSVSNQTTTTSFGAVTCSGFKVMYLKHPIGTANAIDLNIDGGATAATLNCSGAGVSVATVTVAASAGSHTLNMVAKTGGVGWILAVEPVAASGTLAQVGFGAVSGSKASEWVGGTSGGNAIALMQATAPNVLIFNLGTNDQYSANTSAANFQTYMTTLCNAAVAVNADIVLTKPTVNTGPNQDKITAYQGVIDTLSLTYNAPVIDLARYGATGRATDGIHLTAAGFGQWATDVAALLASNR